MEIVEIAALIFSKNELDANHANHSDCWPVPSATAPVCASTLGWKIPDTIHNHPAKAPMVSGGVYDLCVYTYLHIICMYRDMLKLSSIQITKNTYILIISRCILLKNIVYALLCIIPITDYIYIYCIYNISYIYHILHVCIYIYIKCRSHIYIYIHTYIIIDMI